MPVVNRIADYANDMKEWRRWMHRNPELQFDCHRTAGFVAGHLRQFGVDEIHEGIATSGLVAVINGQGDGPTIGLRADMDALPITEATGAEHASLFPGKMHACGHDGHTTMLLGAARYLAETRRFNGRVALIFQPAEEGGGGAEVMVKDGVMDRFGIGQVYALHNAPGIPVGHFMTTPGPIMAAADMFEIHVIGKGGHGAMPHETRDPVVAAVSIVQAIQTIVSRNHHAAEDLVISVTQIHTGSADNIVPDRAYICGTVRSFDAGVQAMVIRRMQEIADGTALTFDVEVQLDFQLGYPATVNHSAETELAAEIAREISGEVAVDAQSGKEMGAEDFAYMLQARPGCYLFVGQGESAGLHHPAYDFNDDLSPIGASFFARLVERSQPL